MKTSTFLLALCFALPLMAEDKSPPPSQHSVIIPYDGSKPIDGQEPERFYLDYATFQDLWTKAKASRVRESTTVDPAALAKADFTFSSSLHRATVSEDKIEVEARYELQTRGPKWQKVPFAFESATAREITLDGSTAAVRDGYLLVEKSGRHQIAVRYEIAVDENWRAVDWKAPLASASMLTITMPDDRLEPVVTGAALLESDDAGKPVFIAALGNRNQIALARQARGLNSSKLERPRLAQIESLLVVRKGVQQLDSKIVLQFPGAKQQSFSIDLDAGFTPVHFSAPNLATWGLSAAENGVRTLEFDLAEPAVGALAVELTAEAPLEQLLGQSAFPQVGAEAVRVEHTMIVAAGNGMAVIPKPTGEHRRVTIPGNRAATDAKNVAAFASLAGAERLPLDVAPAPAEREAKIEYAFQVSGSKLEIVASLELTSEDALLDISIDLPEGAAIDQVEGPPGTDWIQVEQQLRLRLPPLPEGEKTTGVIVGLVQEFANEQQALTLTPIGLPGFDKVHGSGVVVAHAAKETVLRFDQERHIVREVEADRVSQNIEVIAPLVRKHGFTFEEGEFVANLQLADLTPQFDTRSVLFAQVYDTWVSLMYNLDIEVQRSAINAVTFSLPEDLPEGRILSGELREVRTEVVDGRRIYTATFQRDVLDVLNFSLQTEIPLNGGEADLSDLVVENTRRFDRFIVLETRTDDELETTLTGVESVPKEYVPYLPQTLLNAQYFQASTGWQFALQTEKLESTAGNDAVITECELTTAFRANGEEWHRAIYKMLNRSLQFLPVKLDPNAELVAVRVSDEEVRADHGVIDGEDVLLVPLIQTQPGELSYAVELVYRRPASDQQLLGRTFEITLDDPQISGQTVEQTFWRVYAPEGYAVKGFDGNMEEITGDDRLGEKIAANLAEMKRLNKLAMSGISGTAAQQRAQSNVDRLAIGNGGLIQAYQGDEQLKSQWDADNSGLQLEVRQAQGMVQSTNGNLSFDINANGMIQAAQGGEITRNGDIFVSAGNDMSVQGGQQFGDFDNGGFIANAGAITARNLDVSERNFAQIGKVEQQLRFNDNISVGNYYVQKGQVEPEPVKPSKSAKGGKGDFEFSYAQIGHGGYDADFDAKKGKVVDPPMVNLRARGDTHAQLGHGGRSSERAQQEENAPRGQVGQSGNISIQAGGRVVLNGTTGRQSFAQIGNGGNIVVQSQGGVVDVARPQTIRSKGRVSLQVDFPTSGEARHFKKLKDHAQLQLDVGRVVEASTWKAWIGLVIVLGILALCNRFARGTRRGATA